ncbi:MAG: hypothetical protein ISS31_09205 [Kiritimatiellae bacterium]|nr:hypothetical protein [Kiritimatiellia bacterium]
MKHSPDNIPAPPDPNRARLARWLAEWELFQALTPEKVDIAERPAPPLLSLSQPDDTPVHPGDIRLLHPRFESSIPRYVAVAANTDGDGWHVVPFGLLTEPATPGEVVTRRSAPALRVLCLWNQFSLPTTMLQCCWRVDRLSEEEKAWLQSDLPSHRVGPPLRHPLDPRWDYLEMESEFRQRVSRGTRRQVTYDITPSELRKAAEDSAPYGDQDDEPSPEDEDNNT